LERRSALGHGRRRISVFTRNVYRHGLLGHFIGFGHLVARAYGVHLPDALRARSIDEQRSFFETTLAPLFDKRFVRWAIGRQLSLYGSASRLRNTRRSRPPAAATWCPSCAIASSV
jgi:S-adenosylmethionine-diacylglycerol 3-amino-3-carboxypropyl transferase